MTPLRELANRLLPGGGAVAISRPASGGPTPVYRLTRAGVALYARLAEQPGLSLDPERYVHVRLRELGARVPAIVHYDTRHPDLGRSVLVTTEIAGKPVAGSDSDAVWRAAGRDLALLASISVDGFGWIRRDRPDGAPLAAEHASLRAFALDPVSEQLVAISNLLGSGQADAVARAIERFAPLIDEPGSWLAHGDFDASHIFQLTGEYTGVIDFGEMRGAAWGYDLGHFVLHEGRRFPSALVALVRGYAEICPPPNDMLVRINLWSLLIGVGRLALIRDRPDETYRQLLLSGVRSALAELQNG